MTGPDIRPGPDDGFDWLAAEDQFRDVAQLLPDPAHRPPATGAEELIAAGRFDEAARRLRRHLRSHPSDLDARRLLSWAQLGLGELDAAATGAAVVVAGDPDSPDGHLLAAAVHSARKEVPAARAAAQQAIRLAPDHPAPLRMSVMVDLEANLVTEQTARDAQRAVQLDPQDPVANRLAGSALLQLRRRKQAGVFLRRAAELDPQDPATKIELARWQAGRGRGAAAAKGLADVLRADPTDQIAADNLATTVWQTFSVAQLVLWCATVVLSRLRLFTGGDPEAWSVVVGPLVVLLTLGTWAFQLRGGRGGGRAMLGVVRRDRTLLVGLIAHIGCLIALACTPLPGAAGTTALIIGIGLLLVATGALWIRIRQVKKQSA